MGTAVFSQNAFRFVNDDGNEAGSTFYGNENADQTINIGATNTKKRLRFQINNNAAAAGSLGAYLYVSHTPSGGSPSAYSRVTTTSSYVKCTTSAYVSDGNTTTDRLTTSGGTFNTGTIDTNGVVASVNMAKSTHTEWEWCLEYISADLGQGDTLSFRTYTDGGAELNGGYVVTPTATIEKVYSATLNKPIGGVDAYLTSTFIASTDFHSNSTSIIGGIEGYAVATNTNPIFSFNSTSNFTEGSSTYTATSTSSIGNIESYSTTTNTVRAITQVAPFGWVMRPYGSFEGKVSTTQFIANANVEIGTIEAYAISTHTAPTFSANVNAITGGIFGYAICTNTAPIFSANADVEIGGIEAYAIASHTAPVFTANVNVETGSIYGYGNCEFTTVVRTANVNVETGGIYGYADTTSIAPIFSATASCVVDNIYVDILMTHQPPVFTANATVNVGSIIGYADVEYTPKAFTCSVISTLDNIYGYGEATHVAPTFTANANVQTGGIYAYSDIDYALHFFTCAVNAIVGGANCRALMHTVSAVQYHDFGNFYIDQISSLIYYIEQVVSTTHYID